MTSFDGSEKPAVAGKTSTSDSDQPDDPIVRALLILMAFNIPAILIAIASKSSYIFMYAVALPFFLVFLLGFLHNKIGLSSKTFLPAFYATYMVTLLFSYRTGGAAQLLHNTISWLIIVFSIINLIILRRYQNRNHHPFRLDEHGHAQIYIFLALIIPAIIFAFAFNVVGALLAGRMLVVNEALFVSHTEYVFNKLRRLFMVEGAILLSVMIMIPIIYQPLADNLIAARIKDAQPEAPEKTINEIWKSGFSVAYSQKVTLDGNLILLFGDRFEKIDLATGKIISSHRIRQDIQIHSAYTANGQIITLAENSQGEAVIVLDSNGNILEERESNRGFYATAQYHTSFNPLYINKGSAIYKDGLKIIEVGSGKITFFDQSGNIAVSRPFKGALINIFNNKVYAGQNTYVSPTQREASLGVRSRMPLPIKLYVFDLQTGKPLYYYAAERKKGLLDEGFFSVIDGSNFYLFKSNFDGTSLIEQAQAL